MFSKRLIVLVLTAIATLSVAATVNAADPEFHKLEHLTDLGTQTVYDVTYTSPPTPGCNLGTLELTALLKRAGRKISGFTNAGTKNQRVRRIMVDLDPTSNLDGLMPLSIERQSVMGTETVFKVDYPAEPSMADVVFMRDLLKGLEIRMRSNLATATGVDIQVTSKRKDTKTVYVWVTFEGGPFRFVK